jgi:hypothetical protein
VPRTLHVFWGLTRGHAPALVVGSRRCLVLLPRTPAVITPDGRVPCSPYWQGAWVPANTASRLSASGELKGSRPRLPAVALT